MKIHFETRLSKPKFTTILDTSKFLSHREKTKIFETPVRSEGLIDETSRYIPTITIETCDIPQENNYISTPTPLVLPNTLRDTVRITSGESRPELCKQPSSGIERSHGNGEKRRKGGKKEAKHGIMSDGRVFGARRRGKIVAERRPVRNKRLGSTFSRYISRRTARFSADTRACIIIALV